MSRIALAAVFALALAALVGFVPLGGRTLWQRAEERGWPRTAARTVARAGVAAWDWARKATAPAPQKPRPQAVAHAAPPSRPARADHAPRPQIAPAERLSGQDRDDLDRLVARRAR